MMGLENEMSKFAQFQVSKTLSETAEPPSSGSRLHSMEVVSSKDE